MLRFLFLLGFHAIAFSCLTVGFSREGTLMSALKYRTWSVTFLACYGISLVMFVLGPSL